jgi:hypothetical protein
MKKFYFFLIVIIFSLSVSAQKRTCYSFVYTFNIQDTLHKQMYCREYYNDNMFRDSILDYKQLVYIKNDKNEWFIQKDSNWILFFSEEKAKNTIFRIDNSDIGLQFKKTIYICNGSPLYHVMYKPLSPNTFIIDYGDYYFTPKDGFIIIFRFDDYLIRTDMIIFFKELIRNSKYLNYRLLNIYEN